MKLLPTETVSTVLDILTSIDDNTCIHIITLEGEHGSGKDLYASALQCALGDVKIHRFADPLRQQICDALGIREDQLDVVKRLPMVMPEGTMIGSIDVSGLTMRDTLIKVAESNKKSYGKFFYANQVIEAINDDIEAFKLKQQQEFRRTGEVSKCLTIVIPDIRFTAEIEALQSLQSASGVKLTSVGVGCTEGCGWDFVLPSLMVLN